MKKIFLIFSALITVVTMQISFGRQVGGCTLAWNWTPIIYGPCPFYWACDRCPSTLGDNICFCECNNSRTSTVGGILVHLKLQEGDVFTVGVDTNDNLVIYNAETYTTSILIDAEEVQSYYGFTGSGDTLWLDLNAILNESEGTLLVTLRSITASLDNEGYLTADVFVSNEYPFDLDPYRLDGKSSYILQNGSINLISKNGIETIKFKYFKNSNLNLEIFNSLGQQIIFTPIRISANYSVGTLPTGIYFAIINNNKDAIINRKFIIK